ncbi:hypothetical protein [Usitatibacter palustris]|uniref:NIPSNAP protein n=1 Tax=Usitatibacter palustris TaxID=2732487 RepID=A0A6M4H5C4_9PROT|nr:hypothetical protein [Usitatibacter palustris]QJR14355.1 hypothetical protein DSM104440_01151 [Usitatibacter palustris]
MPFLVRAFPVLPGKENQLRQMATELAGPRTESVGGFYRNLGVSHESWFLQKTPQGDFIIVITQIDNAEKRAEEYAVRDDGFTEWFKARVRSLSGIDPDTQPLGPPTEQIFEWKPR